MKLAIVNGSDWMGVYIDGHLSWEGHTIEPEALLSLLEIEYESEEADWKWLVEVRRLPKKYEDVKLRGEE